MANNKRSSAQNPAGRFVKGGSTDVFSNRLGWWERKILTASSDDIKIILTPKYHNRPDLLAYDTYGKTSYMWLVLQFNNILDITTEFVIGKEIHLPTPRRVLVG